MLRAALRHRTPACCAQGRGRAGGDDEDVEGSFLASSAMAGKVPKFVELLKYKVRCSARAACTWAACTRPGTACWGQGTAVAVAARAPPATCMLRVRAQKLVVGMRLWGIVLEVTPRGLGISLPHGLRGHVAPQEVGGQAGRRAGRQGACRVALLMCSPLPPCASCVCLCPCTLRRSRSMAGAAALLLPSRPATTWRTCTRSTLARRAARLRASCCRGCSTWASLCGARWWGCGRRRAARRGQVRRGAPRHVPRHHPLPLPHHHPVPLPTPPARAPAQAAAARWLT